MTIIQGKKIKPHPIEFFQFIFFQIGVSRRNDPDRNLPRRAQDCFKVRRFLGERTEADPAGVMRHVEMNLEDVRPARQRRARELRVVPRQARDQYAGTRTLLRGAQQIKKPCFHIFILSCPSSRST